MHAPIRCAVRSMHDVDGGAHVAVPWPGASGGGVRGGAGGGGGGTAVAAGARDRLGRTLTMVMVGTARSIGCVLLLLLLLAVLLLLLLLSRRDEDHTIGQGRPPARRAAPAGMVRKRRRGRMQERRRAAACGASHRSPPRLRRGTSWVGVAGGCGASGPAPGPVRSGGGGGRGGGGSVEEGGGEARRGRGARGAVPSCVEDGVARRFPGLPPAIARWQPGGGGS